MKGGKQYKNRGMQKYFKCQALTFIFQTVVSSLGWVVPTVVVVFQAHMNLVSKLFQNNQNDPCQTESKYFKLKMFCSP